MKCSECFHYNVCGSASQYADADQCKQYFPVTYIKALEDETKRLEDENKFLKLQLSNSQLDYRRAVDFMAELDEALENGNFIHAGRLLECWSRRNDGA